MSNHPRIQVWLSWQLNSLALMGQPSIFKQANDAGTISVQIMELLLDGILAKKLSLRKPGENIWRLVSTWWVLSLYHEQWYYIACNKAKH